jgi:hypothetical protein
MDKILRRIACRCHHKRGVHARQWCLFVYRSGSRLIISDFIDTECMSWPVAWMDRMFTTRFGSVQLSPNFWVRGLHTARTSRPSNYLHISVTPRSNKMILYHIYKMFDNCYNVYVLSHFSHLTAKMTKPALVYVTSVDNPMQFHAVLLWNLSLSPFAATLEHKAVFSVSWSFYRR